MKDDPCGGIGGPLVDSPVVMLPLLGLHWFFTSCNEANGMPCSLDHWSSMCKFMVLAFLATLLIHASFLASSSLFLVALSSSCCFLFLCCVRKCNSLISLKASSKVKRWAVNFMKVDHRAGQPFRTLDVMALLSPGRQMGMYFPANCLILQS